MSNPRQVIVRLADNVRGARRHGVEQAAGPSGSQTDGARIGNDHRWDDTRGDEALSARGRVRAGRTHWHDLSLMAFLMLVISPIVWSHYLIFMLPAVTALACLATAPGHNRRVVITAGVAFLVMTISSGIWQLQAVAVPIIAAWLLVAVLDVASRRHAPAADAESQQPLDSPPEVP